jgi:hypothetical protein
LVDLKSVNRKTNAYDTLQLARTDAKLIGQRAVAAKKKAEKLATSKPKSTSE